MKYAKSSKAARHLRTVLRFFVQMAARRLLLGGLLGLSGWFITATALAGLSTTAAMTFNVFTPSAAIRLLALGRTAARYGERIVTHDATLAVLAALRERLFRSWAQPQAARYLLQRPARLLFRLTQDIDALESLPKETPIAFICHHGGRSAQAAEHFRGSGFREVYNVTGGIDAWAQLDPAIPRY